MKKPETKLNFSRRILDLLVVGLLLGGVLFGWQTVGRLQTVDAVGAEKPVSIRSAGRGRGRFDFKDGFDLVSPENSNGFQTALASADFDEDGVPDLIVGGGSAIRLRPGNPDSIYPQSAEAQARRSNGSFNDEPFAASAAGFGLPAAADTVEAGDFNADGHQDVLAAAFGGSSFYLLAGTGRGAFAEAREFKPGGVITAVATGEFGRADGQTDIAIGVLTEKGGAALVVYEFPEGAAKATPETFKLPAPATDIKFGRLDEDGLADLAVACGSKVVFVHGHEQLYPWVQMNGSNLKRPPAQIGLRTFSFNISGLAIGDFDNGRRETVALLGSDGALHLLEPPAPVRKRNEKVDDRLLMNANLPTNGEFNSYKLVDPVKQRRLEEAKNPSPDIPLKDGRIDYEALARTNAENFAKNYKGKTLPEPVAKPIDLKFAKNFETKPSRINEWTDSIWISDARLSNAAVQTGRANLLTPVRVSGSGADDLLVIDGYGKQLHIVTGDRAKGVSEAAAKTAEIVTLDTVSNPLQVLPMRLNPDAWSDLVVLREGASAPSIVMSAPVSVFTVTTAADGFGDCFNGTDCTLRSAIAAANSVAGTSSIVFAIAGTGGHTIQVTDELPAVIHPVTIDGTTQPGYAGTPLVEINGSLLTSAADGLKIRASSCTVRGLAITEFPGSDPHQAVITGGNGLTLESSLIFTNNNSNIVEANFIGTDLTGTVAKGNKSTGINIFDSDLNTIGGETANARNLISGNGVIASAPTPMDAQTPKGVGLQFVNGNDNRILGNYIGTSISGSERLGNYSGIEGGGQRNVFGGDAAGAGNVISGNGFAFDEGGGNMYCSGNGITVKQLLDANNANLTLDNTIAGNRIGTSADGTNGIGNCFIGVSVPSNANTIIGSLTLAGRNVISGNGDSAIQARFGLFNFYGGRTNVVGNNIGTNIAGTAAIPINLPAASDSCSGFCSLYGDVYLVPTGGSVTTFGLPGNTTPGGACTGGCNLIAGLHTDPNQVNVGLLPGVYVEGTGTLGAFNNYIGANGAGTNSLPNGTQGAGFSAFCQATVFFGAVFGNQPGGNLVVEALYLTQRTTAQFTQPAYYYVWGNLVGTDATGTISLLKSGVNYNFIQGHPNGAAVIGDVGPLARNVFSGTVSGPLGAGLRLAGFGIVKNNVFGRDRSETIPLPNTGDGLTVLYGPNVIGGTAPDRSEQNVFADNAGAGIFVDEDPLFPGSGNGTRISANRIFKNGGLGIDLAPLGVNGNDLFDLDEGANRKQNFPILSAPVFNNDGTATVTGTLISAPNTRFVIGLFATQEADPTMYGEGGFYQGSVSATTDANGFATFTITTVDQFTPDIKFTAVAQDPDRNSSEFSCIAGQCISDMNLTIDDDPDPVEAGTTLTYSPRIFNRGPAAAPNPTLVFTLPNLTFNFISATIPNGDCVRAGNQVTCTLTFMDPNEISTAEIKITPTQTGRLTVSGQVSSDSPDPNPSDNDDTEETEVTGPPIIVNRTGDEPDANLSDDVCDVDESTPENQCTLRAAIEVANHISGRDYIKFDIPGAGVQTIAPATALPEVTEAVVIDGTKQPGYAGTPLIQLSGAGAGALVNGLFLTGGTTTVKGLAINGFGGYGILIQDAAGSSVEACFIGTDPTGNAAAGNALSGVRIKDSNNNTIGGGAASKRNIISANGTLEDPALLHGVQIDGASTGNKVQGNYLGTNVDGTIDLGNKGAGAAVLSGGNSVGGITLGPGSGEGNVISGNDQAGVFIASNVPATVIGGVTVAGNLIGTDASGTAALPNEQYGVILAGQVQNVAVGGATPGSRNVISGNHGYGVVVSAPPNAGFSSSNNKVLGNYIGTDATGAARLPNTLAGVYLLDTSNNTIGGSGAARNLISGNDGPGVAIGQSDPLFATAGNNKVIGNYIGLNADGSTALFNELAGVAIGNGAADTTVGGLAAADRNTISGNRSPAGGFGILINTQAKRTKVLGNYIGTNSEGDGALPNSVGIGVASGASETAVGLNNTGRNLISGNGFGIVVGIPIAMRPGVSESLSKTRKQIVDEAAFQTLSRAAVFGSAPVDFGRLPLFKNFKPVPPRLGTPVLPVTATVVSNNYIGTDATGARAVGNTGAGVFVTDGAQDTRVGGIVEGRNLISGNGLAGIAIGAVEPDSPAKPITTKVFDNRIGTNAAGSAAVPNGTGITVGGAANTFIGGGSDAGNLISGNTDAGISVSGMDSSGVFIKGNRIGTDFAGRTAVGNQKGVIIENSVGNLIGVDQNDAERNVISGNTTAGVVLFNVPDGQLTNTVAGNYIGTDLTGNAAINGQSTGIGLVNASAAFIGGDATADYNRANVIAGNTSVGISFESSSDNFVTANNIGVGVDTTTPLGNGFGIVLTDNSANNRITQNNIMSSTSDGVLIEGGAFGNFFRNNTIGGLDDHLELGNGRSGARLKDGAHDNNFGDRFTGGNTIQYNGRTTAAAGVTLEASAGNNNIVDPTIFKGNFRMGIDLNGDGILTPNDADDADEGPNRLQNYPEITAAGIDGNGDLLVTYRVPSAAANSNYGAAGLYVEFFKSTLRNEGQTFLNSDFYTAQDFAAGPKTVNLGNAAALGFDPADRVTATATDADGNTSEFFPAYPVTPTAANVSVGGRVTTGGGGIGGATVILTGPGGESRTARTNSFGAYRFEQVPAGETYVVTVAHPKYSFAAPTRILTVTEALADVDFTASP